MRTWVFCVIEFWKEWHFPPCFFDILTFISTQAGGIMNIILPQAKPSPISVCADAWTRFGASQGRADLEFAHVKVAITALCVSSKNNEATKKKNWGGWKKKMFNVTLKKKQTWIYAERERGERIFSQRASLKVNVRSDKNKKEECVMQMKGGTRYRQQAGTNLSGAGNSFP